MDSSSHSVFLRRKPSTTSSLFLRKDYLLAAFLFLSSLTAYLILLIPTHTSPAVEPLWRARSEAVAATLRTAVATAALLILIFSNRARPRGTKREFYPPYFTLTACGIALSLFLVILNAKGETIWTSGSFLQAVAWLLTSILSLLAARQKRSALATQWLVRSAAIDSTYLMQFLLSIVPGHTSLGAADLGLETGILVFAAFLIAEIGLSWRQITTSAITGNLSRTRPRGN